MALQKQSRLHFYPRSPCGERLVGAPEGADFGHISIHALLAESDQTAYFLSTDGMKFLSTLSLRRATVEKVPADVYYQAFLSTLSLRRATRQTYHRYEPQEFLSTLSLRRATRFGRPIDVQLVISIHALLAESDR